MKRYFILLLFACLLVSYGQIVVDNPLSDRVTGYDIEAVLDPESIL